MQYVIHKHFSLLKKFCELDSSLLILALLAGFTLQFFDMISNFLHRLRIEMMSIFFIVFFFHRVNRFLDAKTSTHWPRIDMMLFFASS